MLTYARKLAFLLISLVAAAAFANPFTPGDVLLSESGHVYEYTPTGTLVQTLKVPVVDQGGGWNRGVSVNGQGQLVVFNGAFQAGVSVYDPASGTWTSAKNPNLGIVSDGYYGKVATNGQYAYLTDQANAQNNGSSGIMRYNLSNGTWQLFSTLDDPIDLKMGADGILYSLEGAGSPSGTFLQEIDPSTMLSVKNVDLSALVFSSLSGYNGFTGIAPLPGGNFMLNTMESPIVEAGPDGSLVNTFPFVKDPNANYVGDLDRSLANGDFAQTDSNGHVYIYDSNMNLIHDFLGAPSPDGTDFVTFVPAPEPVSAAALAVGVMAMLRRRRMPSPKA